MSIEHDFHDVFYGAMEFDNFGAKLFRLIAKADPGNLRKIARGFPSHVALYEWWMNEPVQPTAQQMRMKAMALKVGEP